MTKKNLLTKILAATLAIMLTLGAGHVANLYGFEISSFFASAAEEITEWTDISDMLVVADNEISLKEGATPSGNIEIPAKINGVAVTSIAPAAFKDCSGITAVKIPDGIKSIGGQAFENCGLETVYFNANKCVGETDINFWRETAPFVNNSKLTRFVFGENVNIIPENICCNVKNLQYVEFRYNGTADMFIGDYAFYNCASLEAIDLSKVNTIGVEAFSGCTSLKTVGNGDADGKLIFGDRLSEIGDNAFNGCTAIDELTIPENTDKIGVCAFANCDIEKVYFNATACEIATPINFWRINTTFMNNVSLTEFVFGENVSTVPAFVCRNVPSLKRVIISGGFNGIGESAFESCTNLENIHLESYSETTFNYDEITIGSGNDVVTDDIFTFGLYTETKTSEEFDVTVSYSSKTFDKEVKLSVTETEGERVNGSINISDGEIREQIGCFDIKMILADGSSTAAVQPNGKVTVKMAIPANYIGKTNFKIVHRTINGQRENFATNPKGSEKKLTVSADGKYWIFEITSFSDFEFFAVEVAPTVSIKNNSGEKTINYGDVLRLTANTSNMPADAKIFWYVNGVKSGEGTTFEVSPENGSVDVTVKVVDSNGNDYANADISDSQKVTVKSGFFQKLINFFKNLFGISRIISQAFIIK